MFFCSQSLIGKSYEIFLPSSPNLPSITIAGDDEWVLLPRTKKVGLKKAILPGCKYGATFKLSYERFSQEDLEASWKFARWRAEQDEQASKKRPGTDRTEGQSGKGQMGNSQNGGSQSGISGANFGQSSQGGSFGNSSQGEGRRDSRQSGGLGGSGGREESSQHGGMSNSFELGGGDDSSQGGGFGDSMELDGPEGSFQAMNSDEAFDTRPNGENSENGSQRPWGSEYLLKLRRLLTVQPYPGIAMGLSLFGNGPSLWAQYKNSGMAMGLSLSGHGPSLWAQYKIRHDARIRFDLGNQQQDARAQVGLDVDI